MYIVQADVSNVSSASVRAGPDVRLHADDGLRAVRRQALPVQLSFVQLGRGRQGRPTHARPHPRPPGLAGQGRPVDEADRLVRQTQTDQQSARRQRTREYRPTVTTRCSNCYCPRKRRQYCFQHRRHHLFNMITREPLNLSLDEILRGRVSRQPLKHH